MGQWRRRPWRQRRVAPFGPQKQRDETTKQVSHLSVVVAPSNTRRRHTLTCMAHGKTFCPEATRATDGVLLQCTVCSTAASKSHVYAKPQSFNVDSREPPCTGTMRWPLKVNRWCAHAERAVFVRARVCACVCVC